MFLHDVGLDITRVSSVSEGCSLYRLAEILQRMTLDLFLKTSSRYPVFIHISSQNHFYVEIIRYGHVI